MYFSTSVLRSYHRVKRAAETKLEDQRVWVQVHAQILKPPFLEQPTRLPAKIYHPLKPKQLQQRALLVLPVAQGVSGAPRARTTLAHLY